MHHRSAGVRGAIGDAVVDCVTHRKIPPRVVARMRRRRGNEGGPPQGAVFPARGELQKPPAVRVRPSPPRSARHGPSYAADGPGRIVPCTHPAYVPQRVPRQQFVPLRGRRTKPGGLVDAARGVEDAVAKPGRRQLSRPIRANTFSRKPACLVAASFEAHVSAMSRTTLAPGPSASVAPRM